MAKHTNKTITGQRVVLDGNDYTNCIFEQCTIVFKATKEISLIDCSFNGCAFGLEGPAATTIKFLTLMYASGGEMRDVVERTLGHIRTNTHSSRPPQGKPPAGSGLN